MDPNATWLRLLTAIEGVLCEREVMSEAAKSEKEEARSAIRELRTWLASGGGVPTIDAHDLQFLLDLINDEVL